MLNFAPCQSVFFVVSLSFTSHVKVISYLACHVINTSKRMATKSTLHSALLETKTYGTE